MIPGTARDLDAAGIETEPKLVALEPVPFRAQRLGRRGIGKRRAIPELTRELFARGEAAHFVCCRTTRSDTRMVRSYTITEDARAFSIEIDSWWAPETLDDAIHAAEMARAKNKVFEKLTISQGRFTGSIRPLISMNPKIVAIMRMNTDYAFADVAGALSELGEASALQSFRVNDANDWGIELYRGLANLVRILAPRKLEDIILYSNLEHGQQTDPAFRVAFLDLARAFVPPPGQKSKSAPGVHLSIAGLGFDTATLAEFVRIAGVPSSYLRWTDFVRHHDMSDDDARSIHVAAARESNSHAVLFASSSLNYLNEKNRIAQEQMLALSNAAGPLALPGRRIAFRERTPAGTIIRRDGDHSIMHRALLFLLSRGA